jgi:hypothetical protein
MHLLTCWENTLVAVSLFLFFVLHDDTQTLLFPLQLTRMNGKRKPFLLFSLVDHEE